MKIESLFSNQYLYAAQILPQFQKSNFPHNRMYEEFKPKEIDTYPRIIICGNSNCLSWNKEAYMYAYNLLFGKGQQMLKDYKDGKFTEEELNSYIEHYCRSICDYNFSEAKIKSTITLMEQWNENKRSIPFEEIVAMFLSIVIEERYIYEIIQGKPQIKEKSQTCWDTIYYPEDVEDEIHGIKTRYFNEGTEWKVYTLPEKLVNPTVEQLEELTFSTNFYAINTDERKVIKELSEDFTVPEENVTLLKYESHTIQCEYSIHTLEK